MEIRFNVLKQDPELGGRLNELVRRFREWMLGNHPEDMERLSLDEASNEKIERRWREWLSLADPNRPT